MRYDPTTPVAVSITETNTLLERLGIGGLHLDFSARPRAIPEGWGWFRAEPLPEELWPTRSERACVVTFYPDPAYRGADVVSQRRHWEDRLGQCARQLRRHEYVVEQWGTPRTPEHHVDASLVVYRLPHGVPSGLRPAAELRRASPPRLRRQPGERRPDPLRRMQDALRSSQPQLWDHGMQRATGAGMCVIQTLPEELWPPGSVEAGLVKWFPDARFRRLEDRPVAPVGAEAHWTAGVRLAVGALQEAGFRLRRRRRPWDPGRDWSADHVVYRIAEDTHPGEPGQTQTVVSTRQRPAR
ncbi:hypothetical protein [Streptomyces sp. NBC_00670]|uniref:hypothetical protein n=1 Tax=Streptomyces sp. NBC_00670 TaxID=2975804 RepID=UPI002E35C843|nr:hypothetical protein [Streptomyces sp. NBC_00670]